MSQNLCLCPNHQQPQIQNLLVIILNHRFQLFNGDFVDRGSFSLEVILTLFGFKLLYPENFHLLRGESHVNVSHLLHGLHITLKPFSYCDIQPRLLPTGNHETDNMNQMYGFEGEVKAKYTAQMFQLFSEVFQWLPLAQCINNKVLVSSGTHRATQIVLFLLTCAVCVITKFYRQLCSFFREDFVKE